MEAPQARGQGEKGERARGEEGETGEGESFRDSGDGQRNVHLQKLNQLGFIYIDEEHFNRRILCLTLMLEMSPIQKETNVKLIPSPAQMGNTASAMPTLLILISILGPISKEEEQELPVLEG